jgi:hypothetical protein
MEITITKPIIAKLQRVADREAAFWNSREPEFADFWDDFSSALILLRKEDTISVLLSAVNKAENSTIAFPSGGSNE